MSYPITTMYHFQPAEPYNILRLCFLLGNNATKERRFLECRLNRFLSLFLDDSINGSETVAFYFAPYLDPEFLPPTWSSFLPCFFPSFLPFFLPFFFLVIKQ